MARVTELGYIGISVSDPAAWKDFAGGVVGMEIVDDGEPDRFYLRMDQWHHRVTVHEDGGDDLAYVGWRVADDLALAEMAGQLTDAGVAFRVGTDEEAAERRVMGLLKLASPAGIPTEIFYAPQVDAEKPFHPGRPMFGRFVTGDQGMGHMILNEPDVPAALEFYRLIGLTGGSEYKLTLPDGMVAMPVFMRCNPRQHSVAFGLGPMEKRVNHFMFEYADLDDLGLAHDRVRELKIDVTLQLGKHANDQALTFYAANPSGWVWEMGWGARQSGTQAEHYTRDIFGHGNEAPGYGLDLPLK